MVLTERGQVRGGTIVFPSPLLLPEGADVVVDIKLVERVGEASPAAKGGSPSPDRPHLTDEHLDRLAQGHPPPQEWWDADDNPFEPAKSAK